MSAGAFDTRLGHAEQGLQLLKKAYEGWISGQDRIPPLKQRSAFEAELRGLRSEQQRNTALNFRLQQLQQRYQSYATHWDRVTRQVEEGTFSRDLQRARRRRAEPGTAQATPAGFDLPGDAEIDELLGSLEELEAPPRPPKPPKTARPAPPVPSARPTVPEPDLGPAQLQAIFERFLSARRQNHERTDNVKLAAIERSLREQLPKLRQRHGDKAIDFEAVVHGGRVALKPIVRG